MAIPTGYILGKLCQVCCAAGLGPEPDERLDDVIATMERIDFVHVEEAEAHVAWRFDRLTCLQSRINLSRGRVRSRRTPGMTAVLVTATTVERPGLPIEKGT